MLGPFALFMASAASASAAPLADERSSSFQPSASVTAQATATVRIISGVRFGADYFDDGGLGSRRKAQLIDSAGNARAAELLEFQ